MGVLLMLITMLVFTILILIKQPFINQIWPLTIEHTANVKKNIIRAHKLIYLIISYNIIPTAGYKNLVSQLSVLILHFLITRISTESTLFIIKHMFAVKKPLPLLLFRVVPY